MAPPANDAVIEFVPPVNAVVVYFATPPLGGTVASVVVPSRKLTAAAGTGPGPVTVAVNVTEAPTADGFRLDVRVNVGVVLLTVCVSTLDCAGL